MSKAWSYCKRLGGFLSLAPSCGVGLSVEQSKSGGGFLLIGWGCGVGLSIEPAKKAGGCLAKFYLLGIGSRFAFAFAGPLGSGKGGAWAPQCAALAVFDFSGFGFFVFFRRGDFFL